MARSISRYKIRRYDRPDDRYAKYMPSPAEIREACAAIRSTWSTTEENKRRATAYRKIAVEFDLPVHTAKGPRYMSELI